MSPSSTDPRRLGRLFTWFTLNLLLLGLVALLSVTYPVEELGRRLEDTYFRLRGHLPTSAAIAVVLIDDASLEHYGRWPWPRTQLARLVREVSAQHPSAIGLDILLSEPGDAAGDSELAQALHDAGNVILASKLSSAPDRSWADPIALFRARAAGVGHVQATLDPDGIGRRVPLLEIGVDGPRWPLAVEAARVATGQSVRLTPDELRVGNARIWVEGDVRRRSGTGWTVYPAQFLPINFRQQFVAGDSIPPFVTLSAASILEGRSLSQLRGKAVLIGFGASDLSDRLPTPVSGQLPMPGVEVHANLLEGLLTGRGVRHAGLLPQALLLIAFSLVSTGLVLRWPGWESIWIPLMLLTGSYGVGFWLFRHHGLLLDLGPLVCAAALAVPMAQVENLIIVNRGLNRGLEQLRKALLSGPAAGDLAGFRPDAASQDSASDLQQKLDLIHKLQSELSSLYFFRQNLLASMHEGLAVFDAQGKIEFRNPYWERFCAKQGWSSTLELVEFGRLLGHPAWSKLEQRMKEGSLPPESEVYLGGGFWQVRGLRLPQDAGESRWMVVVTDLTSRLERDQARAEALRFVTHELRTPLVSIQGFAEYMLRYPKAQTSSEAAATIFREAQRLVSLINTYLDVLRFDAGARSLRREPIAIPEMVAQVRKVMAPIAEAAEIHIVVELDTTLPQIVGDPPMLNGVLLNLLNNAVKYSAPGSEVSLHVHSVQGNVVFEVSNPGEPILPENLSRLFEPFYRIHDRDSTTPGWGLGLTFVKRIVEEHRGTIEATSDERGIRVRVRIPLDGAELSHTSAPASGSVGPN